MPSSLNQSIKQVGPGRWHVGSFVRERITTKIQPEDDAIAAGVEDDCTYILQTSKDGDIVSPPFMDASDAIQMVHEGGTSSVVWTIGRHVFCKVKARHPDMESEENTIKFVIKEITPQIPSLDVIHSWTERDRSVLILRRIEGSTLREAWTSLSSSLRISAHLGRQDCCNLLQHPGPEYISDSEECNGEACRRAVSSKIR